MNLLRIYKNLLSYFGPQGWWPISNPKLTADRRVFEIAIGAILTQNTAWTNVEKAILCLLKKNLLSPLSILRLPQKKLEKCIYSSGYFKQKAKKLKIFSEWLLKKNHGNLKKLSKKKVDEAREELLSLWGIGEETADSILLYALSKPTFVIDSYTRRLCKLYDVHFRAYRQYKQFFESRLPRSASLFQEYHALIVAWGKLYRLNSEEAIKLLSQNGNPPPPTNKR